MGQRNLIFLPLLAPIIAPDSSGDKTLLQAGVLYGSLLRLGFTHDRTLDCMRDVESFDIEAAFHWVGTF